MDTKNALTIFAALSQETRLGAFRLLVEAGPSGLSAGALSQALAIPHNTLSFHLSHLTNAGIIQSRKQGRSVIYAANFGAVQALIGFIVKDCCHNDFARMHEDEHRGCSIIELDHCCPPPPKPEEQP